jgi:hypothetical protein
MTDHSILFDDRAIRRLLAGMKTETRHPVKPQPATSGDYVSCRINDQEHWGLTSGVLRALAMLGCKYRFGERLWVKEDCYAAWKPSFPGSVPMAGQIEQSNNRTRQATAEHPIHVWYKLDHPRGNPFNKPWTIANFTPRWASRITLTVTDVRVKRLHDMSEADFKAEGAARDLFIDRWDSMHGKADDGIYAWASNPWVFATRFSVRIGNIDAEAKP